MRSLTVPVSCSSLLLPTVSPGLSFSLAGGGVGAFPDCLLEGGGEGCGGSCCCAKQCGTTARRAIPRESIVEHRIQPCLITGTFNYLPTKSRFDAKGWMQFPET